MPVWFFLELFFRKFRWPHALMDPRFLEGSFWVICLPETWDGLKNGHLFEPKKTWAIYEKKHAPKKGEQIYKSPHMFWRFKHQQKKRSKILPLLEIDCNFIRKWFWTLVLFHQVTTKVFLRGLFILSAADARENPGGRGGYHQTLPLLAFFFFGCGLGEWRAFLTTGRAEKMAKKTKYE